jgi:hypothetical protein
MNRFDSFTQGDATAGGHVAEEVDDSAAEYLLNDIGLALRLNGLDADTTDA